VQYGVLEVGMIEEPVAAHGDVARRDSLERATGEIAGEDDVHDVLRGKRAHGRDRVDERDRAFERELVLDPHLFAQLAVERIDEALARVDAAARQEPECRFLSLRILTDLLREIRPSVPPPFELRFETPPGVQAQVDFARFVVDFTDDPDTSRVV